MKALPKRELQGEFVKKVEEISGESLFSCYQCGMCSANCPMSFAMDILPRRIMRLIHLGLEDDIAKCKTIWLCASCLTCAVRCPRGVNLCKVMEALRLISLRKNNIDYVQPSNIPVDDLAELPQLALVSSFRKHTA